MFNSIIYAAESLGTPIVGAGKFQDAAVSTNPCSPFGSFLSSIVTSITVFAGLAFVLYFTLGALKWITAGGDKTQVTASKESMTQATIGLIAVVVSFFVIGIVGAVLGLNIFNPFNTLFGTTCASNSSVILKGGSGGVGNPGGVPKAQPF